MGIEFVARRCERVEIRFVGCFVSHRDTRIAQARGQVLRQEQSRIRQVTFDTESAEVGRHSAGQVAFFAVGQTAHESTVILNTVTTDTIDKLDALHFRFGA